EPPQLQAQELRLGDLGEHLREPRLLQLETADRLPEHQAVLGVAHRFVVARHRGADRPPRDPVARLGEAHERGVAAAGLGQQPVSVSPKQPITSPAAIGGSQRRFCSSDPKAKIGYMTRAPCTDAKERTPESPRSSSCMISPYATLLSPAQPYSSGRLAPNSPSSAIWGTSCLGKRPST